jgi:hypothetical protein
VTRDRVYSASFPPFAYASYPPSLASVLHVDTAAHKIISIKPKSLPEQERNFIEVFAKARAWPVRLRPKRCARPSRGLRTSQPGRLGSGACKPQKLLRKLPAGSQFNPRLKKLLSSGELSLGLQVLCEPNMTLMQA